MIKCIATKSCTPSNTCKGLHNLTQTRSVQLNLACLKVVSKYCSLPVGQHASHLSCIVVTRPQIASLLWDDGLHHMLICSQNTLNLDNCGLALSDFVSHFATMWQLACSDVKLYCYIITQVYPEIVEWYFKANLKIIWGSLKRCHFSVVLLSLGLASDLRNVL